MSKKSKPKGWRREPVRHAMASKGIKTSLTKDYHNNVKEWGQELHNYTGADKVYELDEGLIADEWGLYDVKYIVEGRGMGESHLKRYWYYDEKGEPIALLIPATGGYVNFRDAAYIWVGQDTNVMEDATRDFIKKHGETKYE